MRGKALPHKLTTQAYAQPVHTDKQMHTKHIGTIAMAGVEHAHDTEARTNTLKQEQELAGVGGSGDAL